MIELLFDKEYLSDKEKTEFDKNFSQIKNEIVQFLEKIVTENNYELIYKLIEVYNLFDFYKADFDNKFVNFLHFSFFDFYMANIEKMIKLRDDFAIYSLIDLFYGDKRYFEDKKKSKQFNEKTYPILLLDTEDSSTFIAIACSRFISIIESKENKYLLINYLEESVDFIYEEEVQKALTNISR